VNRLVIVLCMCHWLRLLLGYWSTKKLQNKIDLLCLENTASVFSWIQCPCWVSWRSCLSRSSLCSRCFDFSNTVWTWRHSFRVAELTVWNFFPSFHWRFWAIYNLLIIEQFRLVMAVSALWKRVCLTSWYLLHRCIGFLLIKAVYVHQQVSLCIGVVILSYCFVRLCWFALKVVATILPTEQEKMSAPNADIICGRPTSCEASLSGVESKLCYLTCRDYARYKMCRFLDVSDERWVISTPDFLTWRFARPLLLLWGTFTPTLVFYTFLVFDLGTYTVQTYRQTDRQDS